MGKRRGILPQTMCPSDTRTHFGGTRKETMHRASRSLCGWKLERQPLETLSRERKNRVGNGWRDGWGSRFADSSWSFLARHDMHAAFGHLVDAQYRIVAEVRLLDAAIFQRDAPVQRGGKAEGDRRLNLCFNRERIDGDAAVDCRGHLVHANRIALQRNL